MTDYMHNNAFETKYSSIFQRLSIDLYTGDFINIHDGDSSSAQMLASYTSSNNDNVNINAAVHTKPPTGPRLISSTGRQMYVVLRTHMSMSGTGFSFKYWQGMI